MEFIMKQYVLNQILTYILPSTTTKFYYINHNKVLLVFSIYTVEDQYNEILGTSEINLL